MKPSDISLLLWELHEQTPALAWITDHEQRLLYLSTSVEEASGLEPIQLSATPETDTVSLEDGRKRHYRSWRVPLPQPCGSVYVGGVSIDVTRQIQAETALTETIARQQQDARFMEQLLGLFSHDVRSPLANVVDLTAYLREGGALPEAQRAELLGMLHQQAQSTLSLIDDMLDWVSARRDASQRPAARFSLEHLTHVQLEPLRSRAASKHLQIDMTALEGVEIWGEAGMLRSVLRNLLSNAIKYTPRGGQITVHAEQGEGLLRLHVDDTGAGISDEALAQLALGAIQKAQAGTAGETGRGMGLALCSDLVRQSGSTLTAERRPEGGTRFTLALPQQAPATALRRLAYTSTATGPLQAKQLAGLLQRARANNEAAGVGGVLMYSGTRFFQILDGPADAIDAIFSRIVASKLHTDIKLLLDTPIERAGYKKWSLRFTEVDEALVDQLSRANLAAEVVSQLAS